MAEQTYYDRMAQPAAISDKTRLVDHLPRYIGVRPVGHGSEIADLGAGSGELALEIARRTGATVHLVEESSDAFERISALVEDNPGEFLVPHHETIASFLRRPENQERFQAVVCSSVLHEVWSSASNEYMELDLVEQGRWLNANEYAWHIWHEVLDLIQGTLVYGGRLIVRDGVKPEEPLALSKIVPLTPEAGSALSYYASATPHDSLRLRRVEGSGHDGAAAFAGTAHAIAEAAITCNWAVGNPEGLARESQERYQLATRANYATQVENNRLFTLRESYEYVQPGYRGLTDHFDITRPTEEGLDEEWFPSTNAVWVFEVA